METLPGYAASRQSRLLSVSDMESLPGHMLPSRHRVSVQFPDPDDETMVRSPSASSGRRSLRHGSTVDVSGRAAFTADMEANRSHLKTPEGGPHPKGRRERRVSRTVDEALAAEEPSSRPQGPSTGAALAAAASRRPGADEVFGVHIATLGPGSIFGETALIEESPRTASVTCKGACQFLVIGREDFERVLKSEIKKLKLQKLAGPVRHLLSSFKFYQELDDHIQKAVVDIVRYSSHPQGTVFFRQGDPPGSCYIVLSGTVSVWKNDIEEEVETTEEAAPSFAGSPMGATTAGALSKAMSGGVRTVVGRENDRASIMAASAISKAIVAKLSSSTYGSLSVGPQVVAEALSVPEDWGLQVAVLSPGTLFGEVSLLEDAPRSATAVAAEDCELFSIQRSAFDAVLRSAMNTDHSIIPKHAEAIVQHLPTFNNMRNVVRANIPRIMRQHYESEGSVIWFSGDVLSRCFLLLSGEVTFWDETVLGDPFAPVPVEMGDEEVRASCAELAALLSQPAETVDASPTAGSRPGSGAQEERVTQYTKSQGLYGFRSRVLQAGVLFGADALFDGKPVTNTVTCQKDCLFLVINKTDFDDVLREEIRMEKMRKAASQVRRVLMEFPIFRDLAQGVIDALPSVVTYRTEKAGRVLFNQGEPPSDCFIVLAGEVVAWKLDGCDGDAAKEVERQDVPVPVPETPAKRGARRNVTQSLETPKASKSQPTVQRSPPISLAVRDMCGALSMMLAMVDNGEESDGLSDGESPAGSRQKKPLGRQGNRKGGLGEKGSWALGAPVAALGPGSLVGELALIADKPRSATVTCEEDSEFLVIGKDAFDRLVKREMKRSRDDKLEFLRKHVPHFKTLKEAAAETALYFFKHGTYPRNHRFYTKGEPADGSIHIVWKGGVEVTSSDPRPSSRPNSRASSRGSSSAATPERRLGVLLRGSCFGSLPSKPIMPFSAVSASSACEVISLSAENLGLLPEVVQRGLRETADQVMARRSAALEPAAATGRFATKGAAALQARRMMHTDEAMVSGAAQAEAWTLPRVSSSPSKLSSREPNADLPYPFNGLFKGEAPPLDFREFDMMPGECLAMTGRMPIKRSKRLEASMKQLSTSSSNSAMALSAAQAVPSSGNSTVLEILSPWASRPASRSGNSSRMPSRGHML